MLYQEYVRIYFKTFKIYTSFNKFLKLKIGMDLSKGERKI